MRAVHKHLPTERKSVSHRIEIDGHKLYVIVSVYDDGSPGEIFIRSPKKGSSMSGLLDCFAISVSIALQHGIPLKVLAEKFVHTKFEPNGWTKNPEIPIASSIADYIFRWMAKKFLTEMERKEIGI